MTLVVWRNALRFALLLLALAAMGGCSRQPASAPPPIPNALQGRMARVHQNPADALARVELAAQYLGSGDTFAGIEQLEIARALGMQDEPLLLRLAKSYSKLGEWEQAAEVLAAGAAKPSASPALRRAYSQTLLDLGDFAGAAEAVRPLIAQWESQPDSVRQYVVRALLLAGDAEQASKLLPKESVDAEWLALRGLAARLQGDTRAATQAFAQAVAANPQDGWNLALAGQAWADAGNRRKAEETWERAGRLPDAPPQAVIGMARLLTQEGRAPEAVKWLRTVTGDAKNSPAYWQVWVAISRQQKQSVQEALSRGYAAFHGGDPWQAEALWKATLPQASGEDARELYAALLSSASRRNDLQSSLNYANAALKRWPRDPFFLQQQAELLLSQNLLPEAQAAAEKLRAVAPQDQAAQVAELLSRIALDAGKKRLLEENAQRNRELKPSDPAPLLHLAEWQSNQGRTPENLERALKLYQDALAIAPNNAEALARAGGVLADLKRTDEAIAMLLRALTLDPRVMEGTPNIQLAQLYRMQGRTEEQQFEMAQYQRMRQLKDGWPALLKAMRQPGRPAQDWKALGKRALQRHETWIALCAFSRAARLASNDPAVWRSLAAAQKRSGWFDEALASMLKAHRLLSSSPRLPSPTLRETGRAGILH